MNALPALCSSWILWAVLSCFGSVSGGQPVTVEKQVFARTGEPAELTCDYRTQPGLGFTVEWRHAPTGTPAIEAHRVFYYNGKVYWVESWENRGVLVQNPPVQGSASIRILSVQPSDAGLYVCDVTNPNDWAGSGQGLVNFTVLMPPSTPTCSVNGDAYPGNDITLMCVSSHAVPAPTYTWSREKNAIQLPLQNLVEDQQTGSLILRNLSAPFSGTYTCRASNELGGAVCTVVLSVSYTSSAMVAGIAVIVTIILLLLLGAVMGYFLWYKKRNRKSTEEGHNPRDPRETASAAPLTRSPGDRPVHLSGDGEDHLIPTKPSILV
ncbi:V-set and immunoglobulin domain-containing protein 2-like isoform X2 [Brienomyrus brachyistius]|uniref:V-set and immunoglobulin domain-containing protein 2-like isoform X2 n=1 Tax=Brienomyrus brachyistius TaxID=42636 RepID=UPI0020B45FD3|nr:V-set and immunoglobulin domain-containing protein 2-like isoform X2 [Brienomyrus brachyistius]